MAGCLYYDITATTTRASQDHAKPRPLQRFGGCQIPKYFACDGGYFAGLLGSMWGMWLYVAVVGYRGTYKTPPM